MANVTLTVHKGYKGAYVAASGFVNSKMQGFVAELVMYLVSNGYSRFKVEQKAEALAYAAEAGLTVQIDHDEDAVELPFGFNLDVWLGFITVRDGFSYLVSVLDERVALRHDGLKNVQFVPSVRAGEYIYEQQSTGDVDGDAVRFVDWLMETFNVRDEEEASAIVMLAQAGYTVQMRRDGKRPAVAVTVLEDRLKEAK